MGSAQLYKVDTSMHVGGSQLSLILHNCLTNSIKIHKNLQRELTESVELHRPGSNFPHQVI